MNSRKRTVQLTIFCATLSVILLTAVAHVALSIADYLAQFFN